MLGFLKQPSPNDIAGRWMRVGDRFEGCVIEIRNLGQTCEGTLVVCPNSLQQYGWQVGQTKWKNMTISRKFIEAEDLFLTLDSTTYKVLDRKYHPVRITFHDKYTLKLMVSGTLQYWQKVV